MLSISSSIVEGSGTLPKDVNRGSTVLLGATGASASTYEWELLSAPKTARAVLRSPVSQQTTLGPLGAYGVYVVRLWADRNRSSQSSAVLSLNVPATQTGVVAPALTYNFTGRIRNGDFELPGASAGEAAFWDVLDEENVLSVDGGETRGRIIPDDFTPSSGQYVFCLGDEDNATFSFRPNRIFSISQDVDFTGMSTLKLKFRFKK